MPVTLESRTRRMQVFHLPHEVCCRDRCSCAEAVVFVVAENPRTGERARKRVVKRVPGSITFLARERKPDVPAALLELAQVKAAISRGYLRIVAQAPDGSATPAAAAAATGHTASPALGQPVQPAAAASPATGAAPAPAQPTTVPSPTPAASTPASSSPTPPPAPTPATKPPGKEA
jgi:hypothetical protein